MKYANNPRFIKCIILADIANNDCPLDIIINAEIAALIANGA